MIARALLAAAALPALLAGCSSSSSGATGGIDAEQLRARAQLTLQRLAEVAPEA